MAQKRGRTPGFQTGQGRGSSDRVPARFRVSGNRPPGGEIAAYGQDHITCRDCGAKPGYPCVEQAEAYRTCCKARFADAAAVYVPLWKDANGRHDHA